MSVKISDISLQCDTLIKEKSRKEKRHRQKLEHIFHFSVALPISIKKKIRKNKNNRPKEEKEIKVIPFLAWRRTRPVDSSRDSNISSATLNQKKKKKKTQINVIQEFIMNMSKTPHTHTHRRGKEKKITWKERGIRRGQACDKEEGEEEEIKKKMTQRCHYYFLIILIWGFSMVSWKIGLWRRQSPPFQQIRQHFVRFLFEGESCGRSAGNVVGKNRVSCYC